MEPKKKPPLKPLLAAPDGNQDIMKSCPDESRNYKDEPPVVDIEEQKPHANSSMFRRN